MVDTLTRWRWFQWLARLVLTLFGWRVEWTPPPGRKFVLVAAPHTSNWDVLILMLTSWSLGISVRWLGKKELFEGTWGLPLRLLGGVSVDRRRRAGALEQAIALFGATETMVLALAPEGTRRRAEYWQGGFYWIAHGAAVPIVCGYVDYARKVSGSGLVVVPTGDPNIDMPAIRDFYRGVTARFPDQVGPVRLRAEAIGELPTASAELPAPD